MRIGVYGGSFNPPHVGHAMVAAWLKWTDRVDQVWLLPAFDHPFDKVNAPFAERVALCEAMARAVGSWVRVCPVERDLPAPSFTISTLTHLRSRQPADTFRLVVGADVLVETSGWKEWARIEAEFSPIAVGRVGWPTPPGAIDFPGVSSTEVRRRVAAREPIDGLVVGSTVDRITRIYAPDPPTR